jgi:hypothetical protein
LNSIVFLKICILDGVYSPKRKKRTTKEIGRSFWSRGWERREIVQAEQSMVVVKLLKSQDLEMLFAAFSCSSYCSCVSQAWMKKKKKKTGFNRRWLFESSAAFIAPLLLRGIERIEEN